MRRQFSKQPLGSIIDNHAEIFAPLHLQGCKTRGGFFYVAEIIIPGIFLPDTVCLLADRRFCVTVMSGIMSQQLRQC